MAALLSALLTVALAADLLPPPMPPDIQIASLLYELSVESDNVIYCIEVDGADPSEPVLSEVKKARKMNIVKGSECVSEISGSYHRATRRGAEFVKLSKFHQIDAYHAAVGLLTYRNGKWGEGSKLTLVKSQTGWAVAAKKVSFVL
jgi:hypothetical protein